jgi:hypothetical protein
MVMSVQIGGFSAQDRTGGGMRREQRRVNL